MLMVPIIDLRSSTVEKQMHVAYTTCGFAGFTNVFDSITLLWRFDDVSGLQVFDREKDG